MIDTYPVDALFVNSLTKTMKWLTIFGRYMAVMVLSKGLDCVLGALQSLQLCFLCHAQLPFFFSSVDTCLVMTLRNWIGKF